MPNTTMAHHRNGLVQDDDGAAAAAVHVEDSPGAGHGGVLRRQSFVLSPDASPKKIRQRDHPMADGDAMDFDKPSNVTDGEAEPGTEKKKHKVEEPQKENGAARDNGEAEETPKKKKKKNCEVSEEAEHKTDTEGKKKKKSSKAEEDE